MTGSHARYPEIVLLRRPDGSGYGFFFHSEDDFIHAADSFATPVLRSFAGEPVPGQPEPREHLKTAIATFIGQAFDKAVPGEVGAEGVSRAAAACVRTIFGGAIPRVVVIERREGKTSARPGIEYMRHPGHPLVVIVDADAHGGEAHFFTSADQFRDVGESHPDAQCWLPQIIYRLYARTPSVMAGKPLTDRATGKHSVACRGISFGLPAPLEERPEGQARAGE
ncbi:hypothetical protein GALL_229190 [mine drainage metagenome]|uniref:Uncharacterized protein n=1 Tax=mine drainage metagenome TaxID=410659 RepID=A0A1J5RH66_9ZZZZ